MQSKMNVKDLDLYYGDFKALHNINLDIRENEILSFIIDTIFTSFFINNCKKFKLYTW